MSVFPPDSHNNYGRCSTTACSWDFGGRYKSCSHLSNLYPQTDSTRYLRQVGPIGRTLRASKRPIEHLHPACVQRRHAYADASVMVLWYLPRNCKLPLAEIQGKDHLEEFRRGPRHSGCATPWQPPFAGPAMFMHDGFMYATHYEYQGPAAARSCGSFGLVKQKFWFECDKKICNASSNDNQTMPTLSSVMWRIYALSFTGCEWHPSSINPPVNTQLSSPCS